MYGGAAKYVPWFMYDSGLRNVLTIMVDILVCGMFRCGRRGQLEKWAKGRPDSMKQLVGGSMRAASGVCDRLDRICIAVQCWPVYGCETPVQGRQRGSHQLRGLCLLTSKAEMESQLYHVVPGQ